MYHSHASDSGLHRVGLGFLALLLLGFSVGGCVHLLEPRESNITYYLLDSAAPQDTMVADTTGLTVGLRRPRLASYLDAARIVTRYGENEIHFSEFHRWGEDLGAAINRVVALTLEGQPEIQSVDVVPWSEGTSLDYVVQLRVLRFEGQGPREPDPEADEPAPEGHSQLVVRWTILGPDGKSVQTRGVTRHQQDGWPVSDYAALVSRLDRSLAVLADELGARLQSLNRR